jgi:DNA-3-methyladenine glycosylase II
VDAPDYWTDAKVYLREVDPRLGEVIAQFEEPPLRSKRRPFETLCNAIVGQQISATAAAAIWGRATLAVSSWTPQQVSACDFDELRGTGLSNRKVEYLLGVAQVWESLPHKAYEALSDDALRAALCKLRGVGPWSANMLLLFSYLRSDVFPIKDIGVIRAMERLYELPRNVDPKVLVNIAETWRPYRSAATWYLWRLIDSEPVLY